MDKPIEIPPKEVPGVSIVPEDKVEKKTPLGGFQEWSIRRRLMGGFFVFGSFILLIASFFIAPNHLKARVTLGSSPSEMLVKDGSPAIQGNELLRPTQINPEEIKVIALKNADPSVDRQIITDQITIGVAPQSEIAKKLETEQGRKEVTANFSSMLGMKVSFVHSPIENIHILKLASLQTGQVEGVDGKQPNAQLTLGEKEKLLTTATEKLRSVVGITGVEKDHIHFVTNIPNDPNVSSQWYLSPPGSTGFGSNVFKAWDVTQGVNKITVAVVDTGITQHADLAPNVLPGYDFIFDASIANDNNGRDDDPSDVGDWISADESQNSGSRFFGCPETESSWHGTHVAGLVAAVGNNGNGIAGMSWNSKILPVRALGKCGGYGSDIAASILWAAGVPVYNIPDNPNPAQIINLSLGGEAPCSFVLQGAINAARKKGAVVVVAAGNRNTNVMSSSPANCGGVVVVGATGKVGGKAYYSNYGPKVSISVPGGDAQFDGQTGTIISTYNSGATTPGAETYAYMQGTSMAAPIFSGALALASSANERLSVSEVSELLIKRASPFPQGSTCRIGVCGSGILDVGSVVDAAIRMSVDLVLTKPSLSSGIVMPGLPFDAHVSIGNIGSIGINKKSSSIRVYLSTEKDSLQNAPLISEAPLSQLSLLSTQIYAGLIKSIIVPKNTPKGTYYLIFVINQDKSIIEDNYSNNILSSAPFLVDMPNLTLKVKQFTEQVPTNVFLSLLNEEPKFEVLFKRPGWTFNWVIPSTIKVIKAQRSNAAIQISEPMSGIPVAVTVANEQAGYSNVISASLSAIPATPYNIEVKRKTSNQFMRAPLAVTLAPSVSGGNPLDRPASIEWKIDGEKIDNRTSPTVVLPAGEHNVEVTMKSKFGQIVTKSEQINVSQNIVPTCQIIANHIPAKRMYTFIAECSDSDGYIKNYQWEINGIAVFGGRILNRTYAGPGTWDVLIKATDDAGGVGATATQVTFN